MIKLTELRELTTWLYGQVHLPTEPLIRTQSPDLNTLREVIGSPRGVSALRSGYSLSAALEQSIGDERRFRES